MRVNAGCGTHYAEGWLNTDLRTTEETRPDLIVTSDDPFPFPDGAATHVYMGHVLEHLDWEQVPGFLTEAKRVLQPGGEILATGPDVLRTLEQWKRNRQGWDLVESVLENQWLPGTTDWPNALHHWNCNEARMTDQITAAGFIDVTPTTRPPEGWPVMNWSDWQCAVFARKEP